MISQEHGEYLLNIAKKAVKTYLETGEQILVPEDCPEEYDNLEFEVTVLTNPQLMEIAHPSEYLNNIKIGKDGLMIKKGYSKGLLLPQVATENNFDVETFLEHTCMKAGISADSYLDESCDVYTFQGQIFK